MGACLLSPRVSQFPVEDFLFGLGRVSAALLALDSKAVQLAAVPARVVGVECVCAERPAVVGAWLPVGLALRGISECVLHPISSMLSGLAEAFQA